MINPEKSFNIHDYVEIFLRHIWYIIIPFVVILAGTFLYAIYSPKEYRATTLILVTPQKVPENFIRPTVTSRIEDRLQSINQEILSRTRLEQIISEFKLYDQEKRHIALEGIIELMRKKIQIEIRGKEGYFTITYVGKDPKVVAMVANKLASLFIEENLRLREQQAQGTSEFIAVELNATKVKLEEQDKVVTQFKRQYMNELPEQRESNLKVLEQLQLQLQRVSDNLRGAQDRKLIIQKQLNEMKVMIASMPNLEDLIEEEPPSSSRPKSSPQLPSRPKTVSPYEAQLDELKKQLISLQTRYTEKHPDIQLTKRKIANLEEKLRSIAEQRNQEEERKEVELAQREEEKAIAQPLIDSKPKTPKKEKRKDEKETIDKNPFYKELEGQLTATDLDIKRLKEEESKIKSRIFELQARIENTPVRELAMTNLTRDYQNMKDNYQQLLRKSEEAQQAENLEKRQKGEQFKVIDPARVPEVPFKPNVPLILILGFLFGMGGGIGLAFFREQMDRSFRDAEDLETVLGLRVLANIPKIKTKAA